MLYFIHIFETSWHTLNQRFITCLIFYICIKNPCNVNSVIPITVKKFIKVIKVGN